MEFAELVEVVGKSIEATGVTVTVVGVARAFVQYVARTVGAEGGGGTRSTEEPAARSVERCCSGSRCSSSGTSSGPSRWRRPSPRSACWG